MYILQVINHSGKYFRRGVYILQVTKITNVYNHTGVYSVYISGKEITEVLNPTRVYILQVKKNHKVIKSHIGVCTSVNKIKNKYSCAGVYMLQVKIAGL